mgnify:CR=1 FL=1
MAKSKLRIQDEPALRQELETLILSISQAMLVEWSIDVARRNLKEVQLSELETKTIDSAFKTALAKTKGEVRAYDVRVAGFAVHQVGSRRFGAGRFRPRSGEDFHLEGMRTSRRRGAYARTCPGHGRLCDQGDQPETSGRPGSGRDGAQTANRIP